MKRIASVLLILMFFVASVASTGCGRQPSTKRTADIVQSYFKKYSKKYPDSVLGQYPVSHITVLHTDEIHKDLVAVYAVLEMEGGVALQTRLLVQKKPLGWRAVAWENMGMAMRRP